MNKARCIECNSFERIVNEGPNNITPVMQYCAQCDGELCKQCADTHIIQHGIDAMNDEAMEPHDFPAEAETAADKRKFSRR